MNIIYVYLGKYFIDSLLFSSLLFSSSLLSFAANPFEFVDLFATPNSGAVLQVTMATQSGNTHHMEGCMRWYPYNSTLPKNSYNYKQYENSNDIIINNNNNINNKKNSENDMDIEMKDIKQNDTIPFVLLSSGTEDYFGSAWGFRQETRKKLFHFPQSGLTFINNDHTSFSAYKIHTDDPLFFSKKTGGIR